MPSIIAACGRISSQYKDGDPAHSGPNTALALHKVDKADPLDGKAGSKDIVEHSACQRQRLLAGKPCQTPPMIHSGSARCLGICHWWKGARPFSWAGHTMLPLLSSGMRKILRCAWRFPHSSRSDTRRQEPDRGPGCLIRLGHQDAQPQAHPGVNLLEEFSQRLGGEGGSALRNLNSRGLPLSPPAAPAIRSCRLR